MELGQEVTIDSPPKADIVFSVAELAYLLAEHAPNGAAAHALHLVDAIETPDYVEVGRILLVQRTNALAVPVERSTFELATATVAEALRSAFRVVTVNVPSDIGGQTFRGFAARSGGQVLLLSLVEEGWFFSSVIDEAELLELLQSTALASARGIVIESTGPAGSGWAWDGDSIIATRGPGTEWTITEVAGHDVSDVMTQYITTVL